MNPSREAVAARSSDMIRVRSLAMMRLRAKSDADQLPESKDLFHVGQAAFCGSYRCINEQSAHF